MKTSSREEIHKDLALCVMNKMGGVEVAKMFLRGEVELDPPIIDCNQDPIYYPGYKISQHTRTGIMVWRPADYILYELTNGKTVQELLVKYASHRIINGNFRDFLIESPDKLPKAWKGKKLLFLGTVFQEEKTSDLGVLCMDYSEPGPVCTFIKSSDCIPDATFTPMVI